LKRMVKFRFERKRNKIGRKAVDRLIETISKRKVSERRRKLAHRHVVIKPKRQMCDGWRDVCEVRINVKSERPA